MFVFMRCNMMMRMGMCESAVPVAVDMDKVHRKQKAYIIKNIIYRQIRDKLMFFIYNKRSIGQMRK